MNIDELRGRIEAQEHFLTLIEEEITSSRLGGWDTYPLESLRGVIKGLLIFNKNSLARKEERMAKEVGND